MSRSPLRPSPFTWLMVFFLIMLALGLVALIVGLQSPSPLPPSSYSV